MSSGDAQSTDIKGYVFVVTYGRSGSTLVQNLLNAIDGYCIRGENANAAGPLAQAWVNVRDNDVIRNHARTGETTQPNNPWYGAENCNHRRYGDALARTFRNQILMPPAGTRVTGFKEIRWGNSFADLSNTLNFLHRFLSPAKFVFNTRNLDEVVRSGWWAQQDPSEVKKRLSATEALFHRYMRNNPDRCHHIHYNDYTSDHSKLEPLFAFLGEDYDPELVSNVMSRKLMHLKKTAE
ncbi:sulfotransferase [Pararhodobacter marinus]|uniref:sulfotransferase n=1 Tax=Pararhodobacter marinus TaxID=2184063 RepID=UPI0035142164